MRLRNKKTGEILNEVRSSMTYKDNIRLYDETSDKYYSYNSLAELNEEWEDYEELKKYWFIDAFGNIVQNKLTKHRGDTYTDMTDLYETQKQIGNYFETKEEAEKAVEKLKAWKRLKDKGLKFKTWGWESKNRNADYCVWFALDNKDDMAKDLDLLFGGEE